MDSNFPQLTEDVIIKSTSSQLREITKRILAEAGIRASRKLGQNFAICREYLEEFSNAISGTKGWLLEIGTGTGTLTAFLAKATNGLLVSVEKDPRLFEAASNIIKSENTALLLGDGVSLLKKSSTSVVISSTPFNLSIPIFLGIARNNRVKEAVLGVQTEVAMRISASPGSVDYGRISVISSILFEKKLLGTYSSSCFFPRPKVSVTVIRLKRIKEYDPEVHGIVEKLSACLFSQRNKIAGKVIESCLSHLFPSLSSTADIEILKDIEGLRVREISGWQLEEFARTVLKEAKRR
ncbi:MAG TPA: hypothetical protein ENO36_02775 [Fervidicoccus fontis]|uniref:Ribosomal RNA adenine methylase transferase N-terminal domain-containing protein n=1 Tax=Fervidicoccus fontis TaxID=683846 RepID=A0A7C2UUG4_9CREN|nr:hypothetical protein [Fervidicoccus fontis]